MVTPSGYQAVTNFCHEVQVMHTASSSTPVPITAQDKALADIAEVMAKVKAKAHSSILVYFSYFINPAWIHFKTASSKNCQVQGHC